MTRCNSRIPRVAVAPTLNPSSKPRALPSRDTPVHVEATAGLRRDPRWRPLDESEKELAMKDRAARVWKNKGVVGVADCYWMRGSTRDAGQPAAGGEGKPRGAACVHSLSPPHHLLGMPSAPHF